MNAADRNPERRQPTPYVVRFGRFELDPRAGVLRKDGRKLRVQAKPLRILELLLERPGAVVTRDELRRTLWPPDVFVDFDHNLNSAVNKLREALGDSAGDPRFVETLPRGYRFLAPATLVELAIDVVNAGVTAPPPPNASSSSTSPFRTAEVLRDHPLPLASTQEPQSLRRRWFRGSVTVTLAACLLAVAAFVGFETLGPRLRSSAERSGLAVLPFENLTADPQQEFFSDGFTEEMISQLGQLEPSRLRVIARASMMRYKKSSKRIDEIGAELGVDYVLEGSVRHAGSRVRIAAQLVRVRDQAEVWTRVYERDVRDILSVQADVARAIADEVAIAFASNATTRSASRRAIAPEVHEAYLKGRYFLDKSPAGLNEAVAYFQEAIRLDPDYAPAYAGLSDAYGQLGWFSGELSPAAAYPKTLAAAARALQLDDTLAAAHVALARVRWKYEWNWRAAEAELTRAIELDPESATAQESYFDFLSAMGRHPEALAALNRAAAVDPVSLTINYDYALHFERTGDFEAAIARVKRALDLDPSSGFVHHLLGELYADRRLYADARTELRRALQLSADTPHFIAALAFVEARSGDRDAALEGLRSLKAVAGRRYVSRDDFALVYASLDDRKAALDELETAYRNRDPWLSLSLVQVGLDTIRAEPRYQKLISDIGLTLPQRASESTRAVPRAR